DEVACCGAATPTVPEAPGPVWPSGAVALGLAAAAAAILAARGSGAALGLRPPDDTLVVFLPGHGQGPGDEVYRDFVADMGLREEAARYFDYRWVTGDVDAQRASRMAPTSRTAAALNAYLAGVAEGERPVWLVGFSKGGAVIAELVAAWDRGQSPPANVVGAMLLDPPMASGIHGTLQSLGGVSGPVPDDGGYDPVDCSLLWFWCRDARAHLGESSGVEVVVVRNPRAGVTSFSDHPSGLRVLDAPDDGHGPWEQLVRDPMGWFTRISRAHEAVLTDPAVARCLVTEMWHPGDCSFPEPAPDFRPLRARARSPKARVV
ncbi:MAG TPA: hypothetical protein VFY15_02840, partial [Acidimicrobiia bacterium]|nr:hypothetical protein [Acidimicrobiia bacterium]